MTKTPRWEVTGWRFEMDRPVAVKHVIRAPSKEDALAKFLRAYPANTPANPQVKKVTPA